jgi:hypothetical protein
VDTVVLARAGRNSPSLIDQGLGLLNSGSPGAAAMIAAAAQNENFSDVEKLRQALRSPARPAAAGPAGSVAASMGVIPSEEPVVDWAVRLENRGRLLDGLKNSTLIPVKDLLACRSLTNTAIFSSSTSSSGQALDAAISVSGLLVDAGKLHPALSNNLASLAAQAYVSGNSQPLEQVLLDVMSLGQRLSWDQLCEILKRVEDSRTLGTLAYMARAADKRLATLFAAISLSGAPANVVRYLLDYSRTGYEDLGAVLHFRVGGINELLHSGLRLYHSSLSGRVWVADPGVALGDGILDACWHSPRVALAGKWFLYLFGGFLLAAALHFARPAATALERPLEVRGFHFARESLFALGFLLVVLLLSEPFLAQESQKAEFHFQLRLPGVGATVAAGHPDA